MTTQTCYLAVDIGASSGRHILGRIDNGAIKLEEVHRFENGATEKNGRLVWDTERLFREIVTGLRRCRELGRQPKSLGIDTWGVDFVLLDRDGGMIGDAVTYRDARTQGMDKEVFKIIPEEELYRRTGIQTLIFNSIYQLHAIKKQNPDQLARAATFLTMPDYLNYLLTGVRRNEYSEASTTQLLGAATRDWDRDILKALGIPEHIFNRIEKPGARLGRLLPTIREEVGFDCEVVLPPCHDTESAVLALPASGDDGIYLSSGTWSLMGVERSEPDCRPECLRSDFSNEGGHNGVCFHKNIMGLWLIQCLRKELAPDLDFVSLTRMAEKGLSFPGIVDVNASAFLAPDSMAEALRTCCAETGQGTPSSPEELLACAYNSLAECYAKTAEEVEALLGRNYARIHIMGGGSRDGLLNRLTAARTGKPVLAGPVEATATGNILAQMLADGVFSGLSAARQAVAASFELEEYR